VSLAIVADTTIEVQNKGGHYAPDSKVIHPGDKDVIITMTLFPATIEFDCPYSNASVIADGRSVPIRNSFTVPFENESSRTKSVPVMFLGSECAVVDDTCKPIDSTVQNVMVESGKTSKAKCAPR
jgi:hypothetical protein